MPGTLGRNTSQMVTVLLQLLLLLIRVKLSKTSHSPFRKKVCNQDIRHQNLLGITNLSSREKEIGVQRGKATYPRSPSCQAISQASIHICRTPPCILSSSLSYLPKKPKGLVLSSSNLPQSPKLSLIQWRPAYCSRNGLLLFTILSQEHKNKSIFPS